MRFTLFSMLLSILICLKSSKTYPFMKQVSTQDTLTAKHADELDSNLIGYHKNKEIPKIIKRSTLIALSHYPELKETSISFKFKKRIKGSVMQAQPVFLTLLKRKKNRRYQINISSLFRLTHTAMPIHQIPDSIMIGWIGHELGHIMDYEQRGTLSMIGFGIGYVFSKSYIQQAERTADTYAVTSGMGSYIIATKNFIPDHAELPQHYKDKISRLYLSPDDITEQVRELEEERLKEQKEKNK